jgi:hypothetical protein
MNILRKALVITGLINLFCGAQAVRADDPTTTALSKADHATIENVLASIQAARECGYCCDKACRRA